MAEGKASFSTQIELEQLEQFQRRADVTQITRAQLLRGIVDFWLALGAPPVTDNEAHRVSELPPLPVVPVKYYWEKFIPRTARTLPAPNRVSAPAIQPHT